MASNSNLGTKLMAGLKPHNYLAIAIFLVIIGSIIYIIFEYRRTGALSPFSVVLIIFDLIAILGGCGLSLTAAGIGNLLQDRMKSHTFQTAEAVFCRSEYLGTHTDSDGRRTPEYNHIFEYYVEGKRFEYTNQLSFKNLEKPLREKISIRYNYNNPEEVMETKANIAGLLSGLACIGIAILIIYGAKKMGFDGNTVKGIILDKFSNKG